jgi:predicted XRE-type DNA-binding protein
MENNMNKCNFNNCERKAVCKKYCDMHYRRLLKNGDVNNYGNRIKDTGNITERFHKKYIVKENSCWIWTGSTRPNSKGVLYPRITEGKKDIGAHRFSYMMMYGEIKSGMYVCHKCDTPLCVNPDHLFIGTHKDNMADMVNKGRSHKGAGEYANRSKLTNEQAKQIRSINLSGSKLANLFKVSQATISRIIRKETYQNA